MRWFVLIGFLLATLSMPVVAADLGGAGKGSLKDEAPYTPPRFNWTGAYVGGQIGYGWADTDADSGPTTGFDQSYSYDSDSLIGGFHVGYNLHNQGFVYGVEADIDFADFDETSVGSLGTLTHQTELEWMGSIRARVGYAADRTLFYVTGGWAFGEVDINKAFVGGGALASYSDIRHGWTLGGGVEQAFTNNITARLEYRYTDLGDEDFSSAAVNSIDTSDVVVQSIRAGVSFKF